MSEEPWLSQTGSTDLNICVHTDLVITFHLTVLAHNSQNLAIRISPYMLCCRDSIIIQILVNQQTVLLNNFLTLQFLVSAVSWAGEIKMSTKSKFYNVRVFSVHWAYIFKC